MEGISDVHDALGTQRMFKSIVNAFSHPFKTYSLKSGGGGPLPDGDDAAIKALCFVFLDNTVSFYVHGDKVFACDIKEMTYANCVGIEKANFVIIKDAANFDAFEEIPQGTLLDPHKGATVIVAVPSIGGDEKITAEGPGINGKATCQLDKRIADCLSKVAKLDIEYPKGFELIFADPQGEILAVSRRTKFYREAI
ncbi:MAG: phosphonate C-P lyase system protein PhnH [Oscillospiraceae bacterium]|nr:phosphonate C-P lyase system protein PhnH [Oscillospiraceae bacterium]